MELKTYEVPGCLVFSEACPTDYVAIVKEGEFELSKARLEDVFLNRTTGQIKIKAQPEGKGKPILSSHTYDTTVEPVKLESPTVYKGSKLHFKIKDYLDGIIKEDVSVQQLLVSSVNQCQTKDIKFAQVGQGKMIGEVDVATGRDYLYTLRSKTPNSSLYLISRIDFMHIVRQNDRNNNFSRHCIQS